MTRSVAVFCSENWTNLINSFEISCDTHLFRKLWRLCQESWSSEIIDLKDGGP